MLGRNYLTVNGVQLPHPVGFEDNSELIEEVNTSEAATDIVAIVRQNKAVFNFSFKVSSFWRAKLLYYTRQASVTLTFNGGTYTGRLRKAGAWGLAEGSELTENTDGLWDCPCVFTEI